MSVDGRKREELMRATTEAAAAARRELAAGEAEARRPGDLVLLPATAEHAVEWLLAERDGDRWLLVPADVDPWVGSADVEVGAEETGGPLVLRCRHALWVDAEVLADAVDSGRVDARRAAEAAACHRRAADAHDGSPLQRETDADPAYRRRDAEVATARAVVAGATLKAEHERQRGRFGGGFGTVTTWRAAAAVLLVALVGVGWWAVGLRGEIEEVAGPVVIVTAPDLKIGGPDRANDPVTLVRNGAYLAVRLSANLALDDALYRVRVVTEGGEELLSLDLELGAGSTATFALPVATTPPGTHYLLLIDPSAHPPVELERHRLTVPGS